MDNERISMTEDLVFSSYYGRNVMKTKLCAGISGGMLLSLLIPAVSMPAFFICVPMKGLWNVPVSSVMVMESSGLWEYPFITFIKLTIGREFLISIVISVLIILLTGFIAGTVQLFINNSYITMTGTAAFLVELMLGTYIVENASWLKTAVCLNPSCLWYYCGRWMIENDLPVSFSWSEFLTIGVWSCLSIVFFIIGLFTFKNKDI